MPTRLQNGEGSTDGEAIDERTHSIRRGSGHGTQEKVMRVTGETRPVGGRGFTVAWAADRAGVGQGHSTVETG